MMVEDLKKKVYRQRNYTPRPRPSNPVRNLCADILLQAMEDVLTPAFLQKAPRKTGPYGKDLLNLHRKAVYYFTHGNHEYLCLKLDLDPELVKKRALTGKVSHEYKTKGYYPRLTKEKRREGK